MTHLPADAHLEGSTMLLAEPSDSPMLAPGREVAAADIVERATRLGNALRCHPVANGTIERAEEAGETLCEAAAEIARLRAELAAAVAAERERCAVAAWSHYMDTCRKTGRAPTMWHEWCASDSIRRAQPVAMAAAPTTADEAKGTT